MLSRLADLPLILPSAKCQVPGEVQESAAFGKNESKRENKINLSSQANWDPLWGNSPHLGGFSPSVDVVMFDSSSVILEGGFQL